MPVRPWTEESQRSTAVDPTAPLADAGHLRTGPTSFGEQPAQLADGRSGQLDEVGRLRHLQDDMAAPPAGRTVVVVLSDLNQAARYA